MSKQTQMNDIVNELRDALESAGLLDCDGRDAKREANRIIKTACEKARRPLEIANEKLMQVIEEREESRAVATPATGSKQPKSIDVPEDIPSVYEED